VQQRQRWGSRCLVLGVASVAGLTGKYGYGENSGGDHAASCWVCGASELADRFLMIACRLCSHHLPFSVHSMITVSGHIQRWVGVRLRSRASFVAAAIKPADPALDWFRVNTREGRRCGISTRRTFQYGQGALGSWVRRRRGGGGLHQLLVCSGEGRLDTTDDMY
jgi:hypothetical protein